MVVKLGASNHFVQHSPVFRAFWVIFRPIKTRCKEIRLEADCAGSRIIRLAAIKGWNASLGLHQGTPPGFTHQRSKVERYAKSGNFRASSALRKAPVSKLRRVVVGRASLSERFDA